MSVKERAMPDGDLHVETSGTAPTLEDMYPDRSDEADTNGDEPDLPRGPSTFPGYPSVIGRIARWLFGDWSE